MSFRLPTSAEAAQARDLAHRLRDERGGGDAVAPTDEIHRWLSRQPRLRGADAAEVDRWTLWLEHICEALSPEPEPCAGDRHLAGALASRFETMWSKNWWQEEPVQKALDGVERDFDKLVDWLPPQPELAGLSPRALLWYRYALVARTLRDLTA